MKKANNSFKFSNPLIPKKDEKLFSIIMITWGLIGYLIGFTANYFNLDLNNSVLMTDIVSAMPSINILSQGSRYFEAMRFVWLFYIVSTPFVLMLCFYFIRNINLNAFSEWEFHVGPLLLLMFIASGYVLIFGMSFGGEETRAKLGMLYYNSLSFSAFLAVATGISFVTCFFFLVYYFLSLKRFKN